MKFPAIFRMIVLAAASVLAACTGAGTTVKPGAKPERLQTLAVRPERPISTTASRRMYVRTTAYHHSEPGGRATAVGGYLRPTHSAAADWSWLPAGTRFRILATGDEYIVEDYGSALVGRYTIDIYKATRGEMNSWGVRYVEIEILQLGSYATSLAVLIPRQKWPHCRAMVAGLQKKVHR